MAKRVHDTTVDTLTWHYIKALFWTTDENEFPEYCYSGEFNLYKGDDGQIYGM